MTAKRIIPCLDVHEGRVVKGVNFINLQDAGDPLEQAQFYDSELADELCFLDITASSDKRYMMLDVIERTAANIFMPLTVGGGVRSMDDIRALLLAGADKVSINSHAIKEPSFVKEAANICGSQCIVVAIDAKETSTNKWEIFTHGGRHNTGIDAVEWAVRMATYGAGELLVTSMDRDGTKQGFNHRLNSHITERVTIPVIASGGAGTAQHMADAVLQSNVSAVLAASIFHFGDLTIHEVKQLMHHHNIEVRL